MYSWASDRSGHSAGHQQHLHIACHMPVSVKSQTLTPVMMPWNTPSRCITCGHTCKSPCLSLCAHNMSIAESTAYQDNNGKHQRGCDPRCNSMHSPSTTACSDWPPCSADVAEQWPSSKSPAPTRTGKLADAICGRTLTASVTAHWP